ncbi:MAG: ABC transporter ATP-binding protein [Bacteroidetes bacterium]|nr:MAG: ABC transporter ATP-binding protein [Bacteroidota bacterium]REK08120.1 MAG: ABC transporter ATP-binding protein [Bacteroidota bacterium]REK32325.1 MAG: ABC transporter ATP-binding protein [Bacteroidota bacterium]REK49559.1 MAG: ABC transporter ATP-binding protein [Bacteroidota bacterium]
MNSLRHLNKYLFRYKWHLLLGVLFVVAQNFGAIYPAVLVRKSLDEVLLYLGKMNSEGINREELLAAITSTVFTFFLLIILVTLLRGLLMFLMRQKIIVVSRKIEFDLKNEIYNQYQLLSQSFYKRNSTGDIMNRISEDVSRVRMYLGPAIMYSVNLLVLFILILTSMANVNLKLTLYVLAPLPFLSISIYFVSDLINRKSEEIQIQQSRLSSFVQESFSGIRILKSFVRENFVTDEFQRESDSYLDKNMQLAKVNAFFYPLMLLLVGLSTLLVIYIGGQEVFRGRATTGNIAEFVIYVNMLTWPVASLGWVTSIIQRAAASQKRINEFLHINPEISSVEDGDKLLSGKIEFRKVSITYPESGIKALQQISFTVNPGETLAILGKTGSGKSTIAGLILRLYDAGEGTVLVDGTDIRNWPLHSLRQQCGYVPQDSFLFSDTIANNIAFGLRQELNPDERRKMIHEAAKNADIYNNVMEFRMGFDTRIGERGITLSGGQKQRVSIARAIIKNPAVLIFDDCLSAVDTKTEEVILQNLIKLMKDRTSILISHRISSVKNADKIIFLDHGRILEEGTHESLLALQGAYFELYQKQLLEEKEIKS